MRAEIGPPIDDGRDPSDGGDPARCAGGLVHLAHLGGRRERASNAKSSKPRNLYHQLFVFCTPGHADTIVLTLEHQLASKPSRILKRIVNHESARLWLKFDASTAAQFVIQPENQFFGNASCNDDGQLAF